VTPEKRQEIIRVAKTWLKTPYHHLGKVKHAGADCAMFPLAVYQECGVLPADFVPPAYSMQWHLHRSDELYLKTIEPFTQEIFPCPQAYAALKDGIAPDSVPIARPADFVVFKFGRTFSHGAIVIDWPLIIHSYIPHGVQLGNALQDGELIGREMKFFEVKA
jgi:cell wall-associated NlpC family hydrolase